MFCKTFAFWISLTLALPNQTATLKTLSLEDVVPLKPDFYPDRLSVSWLSDSEYVYSQPGVGMVTYNVASDSVSVFLSESDIINLSGQYIESYSDDARLLLAAKNKAKIYRYSSLAEYSVYDREKKVIYSISKSPLQLVVWGTNGSIAYVKNNNVFYMRDVTDPDTAEQLTVDGVPGLVYFGVPDWVYEEEIFSSNEAMWFSPDGKYLAVGLFNDSEVESINYPYYGKASDVNSLYPEIISIKYPKAGRPNPRVGLQVYRLDVLDRDPWIIPAPVDVVGPDHILGRVTWASSKSVVVLWLNRRQNVSILIRCDLEKEKCSLIREQMEPTGWIDIRDTEFDQTGTKMVEVQPMYYDNVRMFHVGKFDFETLTTTDLSPGNATVLDVVGWNKETDTVYYIQVPSEAPWQRQLWAHSNGNSWCVSCNHLSYCPYARADFGPKAVYAIFTCQSSVVPPKTYLFNSKAETFKLIKNNSRLEKRLSEYNMPMPMYNIMTLDNGDKTYARLLLPPNMTSGKQYPMIVRVYAGPDNKKVVESFEFDYNTYLANNRSFIVAYIDTKVCGSMGVDEMHSINNALGTVEVTGTISAIRRLIKQFPFIDAARVGVWGWSYGGFTTTKMLMHDDRNTLACGAAIAPVTSWLYYDSMYTERYMDTPEANPLGYQRSDILQKVNQLRGRKYLLVHGTGDDNVHFQNSMLLAKKLQHADIPFEQMSYADENHSLGGVSRHFYHTLDHFWTECFA